MTTLEQVLELIPTLTPIERRQVLDVLVADPQVAVAHPAEQDLSQTWNEFFALADEQEAQQPAPTSSAELISALRR